MRPEAFDVYPILHEGKIYNIITPFDMAFKEVHAMLAWLDERGAFAVTDADDKMGPGKMFTCEVLGVTLEVDVHGHEVIVYRRSP
jgi:hypothetical protein